MAALRSVTTSGLRRAALFGPVVRFSLGGAPTELLDDPRFTDFAARGQHKDELLVLRDYLAALSGGIGVLDDAGLTDAAASRVRLIQALDLPPLVEIARTHPDPAYRQELGAFVRAIAGRSPGPVPAALEPALAW